MAIPERATQQSLNFDDTDTAEYNTQCQRSFHVSEFQHSQTEKNALAKLQEDIFDSMVLKYVHASSDECKLPGLPSLIHCIRRQTSNCEVSNVVYIEIRSEVADAKPTLANVSYTRRSL